jgi:hypothetical protein
MNIRAKNKKKFRQGEEYGYLHRESEESTSKNHQEIITIYVNPKLLKAKHMYFQHNQHYHS